MRNDLGDLAAFAVIAEEKSFTRAAQRLGVSQSALSHSMQGLEKRLGLQLLARSTRTVSPTTTGSLILKSLAPALDQIEASISIARKSSNRPTGRIRLLVPRVAAAMVVLPKMAEFIKEFPDVVLDITTSNDPIDIIAGGFDAGIRIGEFIERDMFAVRVSEDLRLVVVGSPAYFQSHILPRTPRDLKDHACIAFRFATGVYRWEFEKGRQSLTVQPQGPLTFDDSELVVNAVLDGVGLGMALEHTVAPLIQQGLLHQVLADWSPTFPGYYLFYPNRRNRPAALSALVKTLRLPG